MNAKSRYRLRLKLQDALLRVDEVVNELTSAGIDCNKANAATIETVLHLLVAFRNRGHNSAKYDPQEEVMDLAFKALLHAKNRRRIETAKRKIRACRSCKRPQ